MKLVLIGGGEIGRNHQKYETKLIDEEIVKLAEKKTPNFLFIGFAASYADSYYDCIKKIYTLLGCKTNYLKKKNLDNNYSLALEKIKNADIIYIGGGDTIKLLEEVEKYHLENPLKEALKRNCVIAGISAGAILLSQEGFSDAYILRNESNKYHFIKGLNFTKICIIPHYKENIEKTNQLKNKMKKTVRTVYGLMNNTALIIENKKMRVIKDKNNIYKITYQEKWKEETI